jgi:putative ABC transport system ATP-binding protein
VDPNLFRYIWKHSKREQIAILLLILASLPFYWLSLDVPKRIVNEALNGEAFRNGKTEAKLFEFTIGLPEFLGGMSWKISDGFAFDQIGYLLGLSFMFLAFVLINGFFKYRINIDKGILAERLLRRMRFDLFSRMMRFRPEAMRSVKPAEAATMINNEVEPIGAFTGDAFVWPVFLSTQALTALLFIIVQSFWLGMVALSIVLVQAFVIPILRRKQLELARQRQIAARKLSGRIGEMVDAAPMIHGHGIVGYTQSEIGDRLSKLFRIRVDLYNRKYAVKYLNTLLSQVTPFFFYAIGGYFALTGSLDIGQLVAVIAAYKDLPPPIKELIDWDQRRADTTIKYQQVISQFSTDKLMPLPEDPSAEIELPAPDAAFRINGVRVSDQRGSPILDTLSMTIERPSHVALVGPGGSARDVLARLLGRQTTDFEGRIMIGNRNYLDFSNTAAARFMAYVSPEPILFPGTLRENVLVSLLRHQPERSEPRTPEEAREIMEAKRTGNPIASPSDDWRDLGATGVGGPEELEAATINALRLAGLDRDIYAFGLLGKLAPDTGPETLAKIVEARRVIRDKLQAENLLNLVEAFDPDLYNRNASIGENLIFGIVAGARLKGRGLASDPFFRAIIGAEAIERPLAEIGMRIAETTIDTFAELPPGHPLFERYSLIQSGELEEYTEILERAQARDAATKLARTDYDRLIALALDYIEPRHRFSLVDARLEQRILRARHSFKRYLPGEYAHEIEFYDPDSVMMAAPLRDNLLFGRIAYGVANSEKRVAAILRETLEELHLLETVYRLGLDYEVGPGGKLLFAPQRAAVAIARCLIRRPEILIVDGGLSEFGTTERKRLIEVVRQEMAGRTLIISLADKDLAQGFDRIITFDGVRVTDYGHPGNASTRAHQGATKGRGTDEQSDKERERA